MPPTDSLRRCRQRRVGTVGGWMPPSWQASPQRRQPKPTQPMNLGALGGVGHREPSISRPAKHPPPVVGYLGWWRARSFHRVGRPAGSLATCSTSSTMKTPTPSATTGTTTRTATTATASTHPALSTTNYRSASGYEPPVPRSHRPRRATATASPNHPSQVGRQVSQVRWAGSPRRPRTLAPRSRRRARGPAPVREQESAMLVTLLVLTLGQACDCATAACISPTDEQHHDQGQHYPHGLPSLALRQLLPQGPSPTMGRVHAAPWATFTPGAHHLDAAQHPHLPKALQNKGTRAQPAPKHDKRNGGVGARGPRTPAHHHRSRRLPATHPEHAPGGAADYQSDARWRSQRGFPGRSSTSPPHTTARRTIRPRCSVSELPAGARSPVATWPTRCAAASMGRGCASSRERAHAAASPSHSPEKIRRPAHAA